MPKEFYDVQDVINAECTLEPIKCRNCGSLEVTFNQYIGDAQCAMCGEWQLNLPVDGKKKKLWKIPCVWSMYGRMNIFAETIEEAIEMADYPDTPLPEDSDYIDGSMQIDYETVYEANDIAVCFECGNPINPDEAYEIPYHDGDGPYCGKCQTKLIDEDEKED